MKTAHEVLQEDRTARLEREASERKWAELAKRWRARGYRSWQTQIGSSALMFFAAVISLIRPSLQGDFSSIGMLAAALLAFVLLWYLALYRRKRDMALFSIIEQEAPELFKKLKDVGIA